MSGRRRHATVSVMEFREMLALDSRLRETLRPKRDRRSGRVLETLREAAERIVRCGPDRLRPAALELLDGQLEPWSRMRRAVDALPEG